MRTKALVCAFLSMVLIGLIIPPATRADELQDAVDNPEQTNGAALIFTSQTSSGGALWSADTTTSIFGGSSAKSGHISGNMYSTLTTTVTGPASLSFYQMISSQPSSDTLKFMINGAVKSTISGTVNWQQKVFTLATGTYTLQWRYSKNATIDGGSDAAWVDKIVVSPFTTVMVTGPTGSLISGTTTTITWNAPAAADKFGLYYTANGSTWVPIPGASAPNYVQGTGFEDQAYSWTVATPAGNTTKAKIKVIAYNAANKVVGQGMSSVPFGITMLQVTAPNGGENFNPVTNPTTTISFTLYGSPTASTATLSYAFNTATSGPTITTIPVSGAGTYSATWLLPAVAKATNARVNVTLKNSKNAAVGTDLSDAVFTIQPSFTISGAVTAGGKGLSSVTMSLSGSATATTMTDAMGKYAFKSLPSGTYTITPSRSGSVFTPASASFTITNANVTKNFTSTTATYSISGTVTGATQQGVTMTLSGAANKTTTTAANGSFSFTGLMNGSYTVTPSKTGFTFDPVNEPVLIDGANETLVNFIAASTTVTHSISGTVSGATTTGVTMTLSGAANKTTTTAANGSFSFTGLANGSYTVTPSKTGFTFSPVNAPVTINGANETGIDFTATAVSAGQLQVTVNNLVSKAGVTVVLGDNTGALVSTAVTDSTGVVTFANPPANATVTAASVSGSTYSLQTFYDVNVHALSINALDTAPTPTPLGQAVLNITCGAGVMIVTHAGATPAPCLSSSATLTVPVNSDMVQTDGNVSFVVTGLDTSIPQNIVAYGTALDQPFVNNMQLNITVDQAPTDYLWSISNIPSNANGANFAAVDRKGASAATFYSVSSSTLSSAATFTFTIPAGVGTAFDQYAEIWVNYNTVGSPYDLYFINTWAAAPSSASFDISTLPLLISSVTATNITTARPTIQWTGSDSTADGISIQLVSSPTGSIYGYAIYAPTTRTSIVFPELPPSLSAFSPASWGGKFSLGAGNFQSSVCAGYDDCLTKRNQVSTSGTFLESSKYVEYQ